MSVVRYSVLRIMLLFGCLLVLWLIGVRDPLWLLVLTAVTSLPLSYLLLKGPREQMAQTLVERAGRRIDRRPDDRDAAVEDSEDEARRHHDP